MDSLISVGSRCSFSESLDLYSTQDTKMSSKCFEYLVEEKKIEGLNHKNLEQQCKDMTDNENCLYRNFQALIASILSEN